jgi:hypothetical protein
VFSCRTVQRCDSFAGTSFEDPRPVINFFMDGPDLVRWELTQADSSGTCRLAVHHAHGVSVEYFSTSAMALRRVQELESLLAAARGMSLAHTRLAS